MVLKVQLDALGNVTEATVLEGPDSGLHAAALGAIHRFRFKPALKDGQPVAFTMVYRFTFMR